MIVRLVISRGSVLAEILCCFILAGAAVVDQPFIVIKGSPAQIPPGAGFFSPISYLSASEFTYRKSPLVIFLEKKDVSLGEKITTF